MLFRQFCVTKLQAPKNRPEKPAKYFLSKFTIIVAILSFFEKKSNSIFLYILFCRNRAYCGGI